MRLVGVAAPFASLALRLLARLLLHRNSLGIGLPKPDDADDR